MPEHSAHLHMFLSIRRELLGCAANITEDRRAVRNCRLHVE